MAFSVTAAIDVDPYYCWSDRLDGADHRFRIRVRQLGLVWFATELRAAPQSWSHICWRFRRRSLFSLGEREFTGNPQGGFYDDGARCDD